MINKQILELLGIDEDEVLTHYKSIEDLKKTTPGMVIGTAVKDFWFSIDRQKKQFFKQDTSRILPLFLYQKLGTDPDGNQCLRPADVQFRNEYKKYEGQNLDNKTLLVWRTGGIGDLLFIQPSLNYLKKLYPTCKIWFACAPGYYSLVNNWKCLDKIVTLPIKYDIFKEADYHVTFEGVIERCKEAESINAYHLFSRWMGLNIPDEELIPIQYVKPSLNSEILEKLKIYGFEKYKYIVFQVRTSSPIRTPGIECWKKLILPLLEKGHKIVVCDSSHMAKQIDIFIKAIVPDEYKNNIINFCEYCPSIDYCASLIHYSRMVISPDSAYTHISAALGVPVLGIYGPFPGEVRMSLYKNAYWVEPEQNEKLCEYGGRYCCLHGHKPCPVSSHGVSPCFNEINFENAHDKINELLKVREEFGNE